MKIQKPSMTALHLTHSLLLDLKNSQLELFVIVDKCAQQSWCSDRFTLGAIAPNTPATGSLSIGGPTAEDFRLDNMCMENIVFSSEVRVYVDLFI